MPVSNNIHVSRIAHLLPDDMHRYLRVGSFGMTLATERPMLCGAVFSFLWMNAQLMVLVLFLAKDESRPHLLFRLRRQLSVSLR